LSCVQCENPVATPTDDITYTVTILGANNCSASDSVEVVIKNAITIWIPNVFTPNGDGLNEEFITKMSKGFDDDFELSIFNRWGNLLFESNNFLNGWDGTYGGELVPSGTYVYSISYHDKNQMITIKKNGMLNLLR